MLLCIAHGRVEPTHTPHHLHTRCPQPTTGNVYNVDNPASLEVARNHIMPLVQKSRSGYVVDLDSLLQVLLADFLAGNSPRYDGV